MFVKMKNFFINLFIRIKGLLKQETKQNGHFRFTRLIEASLFVCILFTVSVALVLYMFFGDGGYDYTPPDFLEPLMHVYFFIYLFVAGVSFVILLHFFY